VADLEEGPTEAGPPYFGQKEEITEGRKADRASKKLKCGI